ncbi:hypothetical protein TWF696_000673 [Orbilia brochopaga]|uniref:GPI anchored protein n=1 Tax=Orbilia brochopaga TaxID=3140254 RepID=A0AAV9VC03_9PEZI
MYPYKPSIATFFINLRFLLAWLSCAYCVIGNLPAASASASAAAERTLTPPPPSPTTTTDADGHRNDGHPYPVRLRLPETAKYRPQDLEDLVRQHNDAVANGAPRPVMKLFADVDAGEKYYFHVDSYNMAVSLPGDQKMQMQTQYLPVNVHFTDPDPDLAEDSEGADAPRLGKRAGRVNLKRQASCPSGNTPCTNIGKSGICCPGGTTCVNIQDTGFGSVGCCPNGQPCGSTLSNCAPGYNQCPQGSGGGCCLPGYACSPNGCIIGAGAASTMTIAAPPGMMTSAPPATTSTIIVAGVAGGLDLCQAGYYPCAASLGYGCCRIGYLCGVTNCPYYNGPDTPGSEYASSGFTIPVSGGVVINPSTIVYPTEGFSTIGTLTIAGVNSQDAPKITDAPGAVIAVGNGGSCPAGFSSCGAEFNGGCCRLGRACGVSYCPVAVEVVNTVGTGVVTVTTTAGNGNGGGGGGGGGDNGGCPTSWYSCPATLAGGCCPSGYGCGSFNCPALVTVNGVEVAVTTAAAVQKVSPVGRNAAGKVRSGFWSLLGWVACLMILSVFI